MDSSFSRSEQIKLKKGSASVYILLGMIWSGIALYCVSPPLKSLVLLGMIVPLLLLTARWVKIRRESIEIKALWQPDPRMEDHVKFPLFLALGVFLAILSTALVLLLLGKKEWIVPCAAVLFALHFYLLPTSFSMWEDILLASAAAIFAIVTPFWFPAQFWLWWLVASSGCALACWLAADLRFQRVLRLQEKERREIDHAAFYS